MHAGRSGNAQEATAPHPPLRSPPDTARVDCGGVAASPSGIFHPPRIHSRKLSLLASLWLDADGYTYEALCTAGAAAITVHHRRCDKGGEQESEEEQHDASRSDRVFASALRDRQGPLSDSIAARDASATCPRSRPLLRLVPHESMAVAYRRPSSAVRASTASAAADDSGRHAECEEDEAMLEVMGRTLTSDSTHRSSTAASSTAARAPRLTSSGPFTVSPSDADVRLDILEEVDLCNVVPILPRTFAVEQLVQQLVPCTYVFAPRTTPPPSRERAASAWLARDGANSSSSSVPTQPFSTALLRTSIAVRYLSHLRKVSDHHLALLRAADSPPATTEAVTNASTRSDDAVIEVNSLPRARAGPPSVPVYMHTTSLAACGGSDDVSLTAARTGKSSEGDLDELEEEDVAVKRIETPTAPPADGVWQAPLSRLADSNSNASHVGAASIYEAEARMGAAAISAAPLRSEEAPSVERNSTSARRDVNEPISSISASMRERVSSVAATGEASPHRAFLDGERARRPERPARVLCSSTSPSSLMSAALGNSGDRGGDESVGCTSFAAAQARYEQYRQLLLQRCEGETDLSTKRSTGDCVITHSANPEDSQRVSAEPRPTPDVAPSAPLPDTVTTFSPAAEFKAAQELRYTATRASLAPSFTKTDRAGSLAISKITDTGSDAGENDMSSLGATVSQQHGCPKLCLALASPRQQGLCQPLPPLPSEQQPLHPVKQRQGGVVVEWSSGTVSYTADTVGLYEEQQARSQRFYHLPPPLPLSAPLLSSVRGAQPVKVAHGHGSVSSAAATEDRSSLRGAVLAQLQRLSRFRGAECAMSHAAILHGRGDSIGPLAFENAAAVSEGAYLSSRPLSPPAKHPSPLISLDGSAASAPLTTASSAALSVRQCRCYRCLPLLVQFAQLPSLTSPVLRRYLNVLHQTALPRLPAQQRRSSAAPTLAVEVGVVSSLDEPPESGSKRAPSSRTETLAAKCVPEEPTVVGARASRDRRRRCEGASDNGRRRRLGAEDAVMAANGSERSRKGREGSTVVVPSSAHSPQAGGGAQRPRGAVDPLEVFPVLQQWLKREEERARYGKGMPPNRKRVRTEWGDGALPSSGGIQQGCGAASPPVAKANTSHRHQGPTGASCAFGKGLPRASGVDFLAITPTEALGTDVGSLDWVDDAVLDEVAVVGVVPRGHPHQLQLVAPSHAFCLTLTQRLEEVAEAAVQILGFMTSPHLALPSPMLAGISRAAEAAAGGKASERRADWRAWLEAQYFAAMWTALQRRLTPAEWQAVLQEARGSPFLGRWVTAAAAPESGGDGAVFSDHTARVEMSNFGAGSGEKGMAASPAAEDDKAEAVARKALVDMRASVRSAAESHTSACLSAAEDLVARVVLTALVPILHRRITVMYELLRHFASKSLYMSRRKQCDAYQHWYSVTPSPAAVLRLLQRSRRFSGALARCYPQYHLSPAILSPLPTLDDDSDAGSAARAAVASMSFPSPPLSCSVDDAGNATAAESGLTAQSPSKCEEHLFQRNGFSTTRTAASPVCAQACATAPAESRGAESPPSLSSSSSPTSATAPIAATSAWMSLLPSSSDEASPHALLQQQQAAMTYVPEAALLDPRYLQRFAWWMHRAHHSSGMNSSGSAISISGSDTGGVGAEVQQTSRVANTVLSIPGDYLRVLPMQEQDASIRTVLRSMAQKGRTMDLWEMSQHIHTHHASYVYH